MLSTVTVTVLPHSSLQLAVKASRSRGMISLMRLYPKSEASIP
jgi:hypothetical protein